VDTEILTVDTEAAMEALLNHVGRVVRNESTTVADCRTHIHGLQRKLKSTKELLEHRVLLRYSTDDDDNDCNYDNDFYNALR